jgi:hypothetical protein
MVVNDKDKEFETPQPQETQPTTPTPTNSLEYLAMANKANVDAHMGIMDTMGERVAQRNAEIEQAQKNREESLRKANEARENHTSTLGALWQKKKPVYDEDRAKRVRNNAIIQSFGDMMNAALRGYFAFRPQGAGVYPNISENSPLKNIEELNRMREQYLKRNEEWKNLGYEIEASEAEAKVKAAESLATLMDAEYKEALKRGENAEEALQSAYEAAIKAQYEGNKAIATAWGKEEAEDRRDARAKDAQDRADARAARKDGGDDNTYISDKDKAEYGRILNEIMFGKANGLSYEHVTTSTKPDAHGKPETTTTKERRPRTNNDLINTADAYINDEVVAMLKYVESEGRHDLTGPILKMAVKDEIDSFLDELEAGDGDIIAAIERKE